MPETALDGSSPSELETPAAAAADTGASTAATSSDADPAKSSGADQGANTEPKALLDIVKDVVKKPEEGEASPALKPQEGSSEGKPAAGKAAVAESKDDDASVPFHKHPRWQEKVASERKLKGELETLTGQVTELKRSADQLQVIENFRTTNGISVDEVVAGFKTMALIKTDPAKALPELRKIVSTLELAIGERLPADLQEQVDKGAIDETAAKETARLRAVNKRLTDTVDQSRTRETEREVAGTKEAIRSEVSKWEAGLKTSDPDWSEKQDLVRDKVLAIVQETGKAPRTPEDALALARVAYEEVNKTFARLRPAPRRTSDAPASGTSATGAKAQPKTLLEAARMAVAA
jgi:hypothetical protein